MEIQMEKKQEKTQKRTALIQQKIHTAAVNDSFMKADGSLIA